MRVLFLTGREIEYSRNAVLLRAFKKFASVDVIEASTTKPIHYIRNLKIVFQGLSALTFQSYDLVFIGFYGHIILRLLSPFIRQPILFDAFISNYDTLCFDRKLFRPDSLLGYLSFWLDQANGKRATHLLIDTDNHAKYFVDTFGLSAKKISSLPVGCRDDIFDPHLFKQEDPSRPASKESDKSRTRVLYYCTYLPLHGVETVLNAAKALEHEPIDFNLVGNGSQFHQMIKLADTLAIQNVTFQPPLPVAELAAEIVRADICLGGHFGISAKARRVVPGKIYQMLAMGRPIIATNTPANSKLMSHQKTAYLIPPKDSAALSNAIITLHNQPSLRQKLATHGRQLYLNEASEEVITDQLRTIVADLTKTI